MCLFRRIQLKIMVLLYLEDCPNCLAHISGLFWNFKAQKCFIWLISLLHMCSFLLSHVPLFRWAYSSPTVHMILSTLKETELWSVLSHIDRVYTSVFNNAFSILCSDKNLLYPRLRDALSLSQSAHSTTEQLSSAYCCLKLVKYPLLKTINLYDL